MVGFTLSFIGVLVVLMRVLLGIYNFGSALVCCASVVMHDYHGCCLVIHLSVDLDYPHEIMPNYLCDGCTILFVWKFINQNMEVVVIINTGSCGCGAVEFTFNSEILNVVNCHCAMCRKHNGSAFSTYAAIPHKLLEVTKGRELISEYKVASGKKHFCSHCGTPLFNLNEKYPGACMIFLGALSDIRDVLPKINVWCESQLSWVVGVSELPSLPHDVESK